MRPSNISELLSEKRQLCLDAFFLLLLVMISALPYINGLKFYSDDWAFLSKLVHHQPNDVLSLFRVMVIDDANLRVRPVQALYLALSFKAFGLNALPYHLVGTLLLGFSVVTLYLVLRQSGIGRGVAIALSSVFGMLPHYSTNRFWIASQQANLSVLFALIGIYSMLRLSKAQRSATPLWGAIAAASFILSLLSYEVAVGLIAAVLVLKWVRLLRAEPGSNAGIPSAKYWVAGITLSLIAVGIAKTATQERFRYHGHPLHFLGGIGRMVVHGAWGAMTFNLWTYGAHLPWVIVSLARQSALGVAALSVATITAIAVITLVWTDRCGEVWPWRTNLKAIAIGLAIYFLGTFLFIPDVASDFSAPGPDNRIMIASALGTAVICVGLLGLFSGFITRSMVVRWRVFSILVGVTCGVYCIVVSGIAFFWTDAALRQAAILQSIRADVPAPPSASVLLLDGFCRYRGPAPVLETDWDSTGALQLLYGDFSLSADVVSKSTHFTETAVETTEYGEAEGRYPYSRHLFIYNLLSRSLQPINSREAALRDLGTENRDSGCPIATDGKGVRVF